MRRGGTFRFVLALLAASGVARAETSADAFLACSAEFAARATYAETLGHSEAGHIGFLRGRSEMFLRLAEARAPRQQLGCGVSGLAIELVLCTGPAFLLEERDELAADRLVGIVEAQGGQYQLAACVVDDVCAGCLTLFNRAVRERYPLAWKTTPPQ